MIMIRKEVVAISILWTVSMVALWVVVLVETCLLLLLLHALGELRSQSFSSPGKQNMHGPDPGGLEIGETAPLFVAPDQYGKEIRLADFRGARCILAFVSAGCEACEGTAKALQALHSENPVMSILFVGTPLAQRNREYSTKHKIRFPLLTPGMDLAQESYRVQTVPFVFVLDEEGIVRAKGVVNTVEHARDLLNQAYSQAIV